MTGIRRAVGVFIGLLGTSAGGFALGRLTAHPEPLATFSQSPQLTSTTPEEFLQYASSVASEAESSDSHRSELLRAIALRLQRADPLAARATWNTLSESITAGSASRRDATDSAKVLAELVAFQDALDDTMLNSDSVVQFDDVWKVRQEVEDEIIQRRKVIIANLKGAMPKLRQSK